MTALIFSIYPILPAALGPGVYWVSKRNEYQKQKNNVSEILNTYGDNSIVFSTRTLRVISENKHRNPINVVCCLRYQVTCYYSSSRDRAEVILGARELRNYTCPMSHQMTTKGQWS
jgi:hypothetical protein